MATLETNVFPIINLQELTSEYRLYRIKGLNKEQSEYYQNLQYIRRTLSYQLRNPVTTVEFDNLPHLVVRCDAHEPPSPYPVVRAAVAFERCPGNFKLDYSCRSPENDEICLRFLQFMIQEPLRANAELWQPGAGQPFFRKMPLPSSGSLLNYSGFSVRVLVVPGGGLGLCVDVTTKVVSRSPLPTHMDRDTFSVWKGGHCIYHFGHLWYEIQISALSDFNVSDYPIHENGGWTPLLKYIVRESTKPIPIELANLAHDCSVIVYRDHRGEERAAPTPLCFLVRGTDDTEAGERHGKTIIPPHKRRKMIYEFANNYLSCLRFGNSYLRVAGKPLQTAPKIFNVPDYRFGNNQVLSVRGTPSARHASLDNLGRTRLDLLRDRNVGFYCTEALDRQYFIMPQSVFESYGKQFLKDLKRYVEDIFPYGTGYDPEVVTYDDMGPKRFLQQGSAILKAVECKCQKPGYGVVMIHHTTDRRLRQEDQLAAMVMRELRQRKDICTAVIHSDTAQGCYSLVNENGEPAFHPIRSKLGKLQGYLRNVALNKVLLTNQRWPFILETPLHADVTIGIDVKNHTAGLVVVSGNGEYIRTLQRTSRQKEKFLHGQLMAYLVEILRSEAVAASKPISTIAIHRDGRIYASELKEAQEAIHFLIKEQVLAPDTSLTLLEIAKTSMARFRLFDLTTKGKKRWIENPQVGCFMVMSEIEGYLCSTGRAFMRPGTVRPLHVRRIYGPLTLEQCLEDLYYLTALAWTRPEDCSRYPITLKLNDRFLGEEATDYDAEALYREETLNKEEAL